MLISESGFAEIQYSDVGSPCIGSDIGSDIEADIGTYSEISTDNISFRLVLLPGTNTTIAIIMTAIAVGIEYHREMDKVELRDYLDQDPDIAPAADLGPYASFLQSMPDYSDMTKEEFTRAVDALPLPLPGPPPPGISIHEAI